MTTTTRASSVTRWKRRLRTRRLLLADARRDLRDAVSAADRADARARIRLRRKQVREAEEALAKAVQAATTARERVVRAAMLGVKNRDRIAYTLRAGRWDGIDRGCRSYRGEYPRKADCSSFATWCIWDALGGRKVGSDIVNGAHWKAGFTGTQLKHGRRVSLSHARPGDLVFYSGSNGVNHVAVAVAPGRVVSHGSQAGPMLLPVTYRPVTEVRSYLP